jgi:retinol dehydrogenase-12
MQLLLVRELANQVTASNKDGRVIVSVLNPGWVRTDLDRLMTRSLLFSFGRKYIARDAEVGSRTLVDAANGAPETHGQYLSDCRVSR